MFCYILFTILPLFYYIYEVILFNRNSLYDLERWSGKTNRKPLIIRGARQVGKTTLVKMFANNFDNFLSFNLDKKEDYELFEKIEDIDKLVEAIFLLKKKKRVGKRSLIFIDEIQSSPNAVKMLRYFYEDYNELYIIAAGSLLEVSVDYKISFPVGRVEFLHLYPLNFSEYLNAIGENEYLEMMGQIPFPEFLHRKLLEHFYDYTFIGGMPEVIKTFKETKDINYLNDTFNSLLNSYLEDVEKYAKNKTNSNVLRFLIRNSLNSAGKRITFNNFGNSNYRSREVVDSFRTLEKAMLLKLVYPTISVKIPIIPDSKKAPKLFLLDTGLVNYFAGLTKTFAGLADLNEVYNGNIAEQIVAQELQTIFDSNLTPFSFWIRAKSQSTAEVDFLYTFDNLIIPIEVKAGSSGKLRSLNLFMDMAPHSIAVRIYSGKLLLTKSKTNNGKIFTLLNLPFYLLNKIELYLTKLRENEYQSF